MSDKTYTQEDLDTAKKITQIDSNVTNLNHGVESLAKEFRQLNETILSLRKDVSQAGLIAQEAKNLTDKHELRIVAIELKESAVANKVQGAGIVWRSILSVIGFSSTIIMAILGIISILQKLH